MTTPWKLITHKSDSWTVKAKKKVARWLWNDLTAKQDLPEPAEGYPNADPPPEHLLESFGHWVHDRFDQVLHQVKNGEEGDDS